MVQTIIRFDCYEVDPASPLVRMLYAVGWLMPQARIEEAIAELEHGLQSDPLSLLVNAWLGVMLALVRKMKLDT